MNTRDRKCAEPIRMLFELERADNPKLYDELIQFTKGNKRVNRLRLLAHEGLLAQRMLLGPVTVGSAEVSRPFAPDSGESMRTARALVVQAFDVPDDQGD